MWRAIQNIVEVLIVTICLPFYALLYVIGFPLSLLLDVIRQRRIPSLGQEVSHFVGRDSCVDYQVASVSRIGEGLVGVKQRKRYGRGQVNKPSYDDEIKFIAINRFWQPRPLWAILFNNNSTAILEIED